MGETVHRCRYAHIVCACLCYGCFRIWVFVVFWFRCYLFVFQFQSQSEMSLYNNSSHCLSRLVRTSLQRCRCRAMASAHKYNALPIGEKVSASKLTAWNQEAASIGLKSKLAAIETATPTEPVGDSQKKVGKFIEEVLSRTLSLETNELKSLYHLCSVQLNDHYQTNESILMLANLLKTYYSPRDIYWNPKIFKVPYHVVYNRYS